MATCPRVCNSEEQLCLKLETVISLYKDLQKCGNEKDNLLLLSIMRDVKNVLSDKEQEMLSKKNESIKLEWLLTGLSNHVGVIALGRLLHDVRDIKDRLENFEGKIESKGRDIRTDTLITKTESSNSLNDDDTWKRISKNRQDILDDTELLLRKHVGGGKVHPSTTIPYIKRRMNIGRQTTPGLVSVDKRLSERVEKLENFLHEKKSRLRSARGSRLSSIKVVKEVECTIHNSESAIERSRIARREKQGSRESRRPRSESTIVENTYVPSKTSDEGPRLCYDCRKVMKEKDKFWGLESDSDEEFNETVVQRCRKHPKPEIMHLNELDVDELFETLSLQDDHEQQDFKTMKTPSRRRRKEATPIAVEDPNSPRAFIIKQKPTGHAGRGTWATPPFVPPWTVTEVEDKSSVKMEIMKRPETRHQQNTAHPPAPRMSWPRRLLKRLADG